MVGQTLLLSQRLNFLTLRTYIVYKNIELLLKSTDTRIEQRYFFGTPRF
jgi:hypothetical protein